MLKTSLSSTALVCLAAFGLSIVSVNATAHNPNNSTFILSQAADGKYLVRLDGALTGVEAQINETYSPDAYKTAEEFQQLANEHFIKSLTLSINDQPIIVVNPSVQLGHATQFSAEAQGIDHTIESIDLTNTFFKDLHGNRMTVVLLSDQFPKTQYTLNDSNQHRLSLQLVDGQWQQNSSDALPMAADDAHTHDESSQEQEGHHHNEDSHNTDDDHSHESANTLSDSALDDNDVLDDGAKLASTPTLAAADKSLFGSIYILGFGAVIALLIGARWFFKKKP
ncbi:MULTISPECIES: hypothetical protein [unclassified Psychrobacter]|uniref:hypothetical protein n=1 Tax=unclassified Psychrobacter TaxID=196806 RepID=UPI001787CA18|nr:hypothetical protein [Psychrobacter sp. FME13]MBE0441745.1 hypothetical protein [Psychrobacter sp. FME13]